MPKTNQHSQSSGSAAGLIRLNEILDSLGSGLIAVSGGVDSRTLFVQAVFFRGPHISRAETAQALDFLASGGHPHHILDLDPLSSPEVRTNAQDRCYHCKLAIFSQARTLATSLGLKHVLDGTQASDSTAYRPGRRALAELGIRSPLAEAGLTKPQVRTLAASLGLSAPDQPARPCLLTRFAYGLEASSDDLRLLDLAEEALAALGLRDFRLRRVGPGRHVLQIAAAEREGLGMSFPSRAKGLLAGLGMADAEIVWSEKVSGYYDSGK